MKGKSVLKEVLILCGGLGATNFIDSELFSFVVGQGPSMIPTFGENNVLMINKLKWKLGLAKKGDIVFSSTPADLETKVVKRIAHIPGDTVILKNGDRVKLEPNQYWLLGDNPDKSFDSRHFGPVPSHMIGGIVSGVIYPTFKFFNEA